MSLKVFTLVLSLSVCLTGAAYAQAPSGPPTVSLTAAEGSQLQVILTGKLRFKENEPVRARTIEPIYAFDREVVPAGTEVLGRITGFQNAGKASRLFSMLSGDFTPYREPRITLDTLVLADGQQIPIQTSVIPGVEKDIDFNGMHRLVPTDKKPGTERLKNFLWSLAPYHPQSLAAGTHLAAVVQAPIQFGTADLRPEALDQIGSMPPAGSTVSARLITPLDSHTSQPGTAVEAVLTRPLFASDRHLIFPVGSTLRGEVQEVRPARLGHRNAEMAFTFSSIELPPGLMSGQVQEIDGRLAGVAVARSLDDIRIDEAGKTRISESKKRFLAPAYAFVKAGRMINDTADPIDRALVSAYQGKVTKQVITGKNPSLGLAGSVSGAMIPQVGIGLGFFSAARSVNSNFVGRGQDIRLPAGTPMQIRLH